MRKLPSGKRGVEHCKRKFREVKEIDSLKKIVDKQLREQNKNLFDSKLKGMRDKNKASCLNSAIYISLSFIFRIG
jgi:hypothetical protein